MVDPDLFSSNKRHVELLATREALCEPKVRPDLTIGLLAANTDNKRAIHWQNDAGKTNSFALSCLGTRLN